MDQVVEVLERLAVDSQFRKDFELGREEALSRFPGIGEKEREAFLDLEVSSLDLIVDLELSPIECRILQISW